MKVALIALGCEKNTINSEQMLWHLDNAGFETVADPAEADVTVVNTCGFIQSAKQEAIDNILELSEYNCKIVVAGCLAERYKQEIFNEIPEVSGLVGVGSFDDIVQAVKMAYNDEKPSLFAPQENSSMETPRIGEDNNYSAYIKLAEGCDNCCSYCVIPNIRGKYRSRNMEAILNEAHILVKNGAKELILIAQDTSKYGTDLYGEKRLVQLLNELCKIENLEWIRIHYLYPDGIDDNLIEIIAKQDKICKYLDIPIQHCNDRILKEMNRRCTKSELEALFAKLRSKIDNLVLRTSLIVGFPGETEDEFTELCNFLREQKLERAGCFEYSAEENTVAHDMPNQIEQDVKQRRAEIVAEIQAEIMEEFNQKMQDRVIDVLCEGHDRYAGCYFGRSYADSPEVDGKIFFTSKKPIDAGKIIKLKITDSIDGDLFGTEERR